MTRFGTSVTILVAVLLVGGFLVWHAINDPTPGTIETTTSPTIDTTVPETTTTDAESTTSTSETTTTETAPATTNTTTPPSSTPTTATITTRPAAPPFSASISTVTAGDLPSTWRSGCPVAPNGLRKVTMTHWNYDNRTQEGELVVAAELVDTMIAIFLDLYEVRFPIERMVLVDEYNGDDDASMAANNTSAFNCRQVTGGSSYSEHSYGRAIDINPLVNPYVNGSTVLPPAGTPYADRSLDAPGMIHANDEVVLAFGQRGWIWGGTWSSIKDYQHFSTTGR